MRAEINRKLDTLTTPPVLQSQTIKKLNPTAETKIINLEAVILARSTRTPSPLRPERHIMTLSSGRW